MKLRGIYDHGKVTLTGKDLPDIKTEAVIEIDEQLFVNQDTKIDKFLKYVEKNRLSLPEKFPFNREELHER